MINQSMIKMAKMASKDDSLLAFVIDQYGKKEGLQWEEIAKKLRIDGEQLAKLALCRRPRQSKHSDDIERIADYVGMNKSVLQQFVLPAKKVQKRPNIGEQWQVFKEEVGFMFKRRTWAIGFAALILLIIGAVAFAQPRGSEATLVVSKGQATIIQARGSLLATTQPSQMVTAGKFATVSAGDEISLAAGSTAQLRLFDGSTVDLFENSSVQVKDLYTTQATYQVRLHMLAGKTVSRVVRLLGVGDAFEVSTPSSTASVRGTVFTVEVISADTTFISCDEGKVAVAMEGRNVDLPAGTQIKAVLGNPLEVVPQKPTDPPNDAPPVDTPDVPPGPPSEVPGNPPIVPGFPPARGENAPDVPGVALAAVLGRFGPPSGHSRHQHPYYGPPHWAIPGDLGDLGDLSGRDPDDPCINPNPNENANDRAKNKCDNTVPGHTPDTVPGQGNPPAGSGPPPGGGHEGNPGGGNAGGNSGNNPNQGPGNSSGQGNNPTGSSGDVSPTGGGNGKDK